MTDVVAMGELLIDFTCKRTDRQGYPTMEAHPGGISSVAEFSNVLAATQTI